MSFADVPGLLVAYLTPIMRPVPVATRIPRPNRPTEFVHIRRNGGVSPGVVREAPRIDVRCWAKTEPRAYQIASSVREAIWALAGNERLGVVVYQVDEFMGPNQVDDDQTGDPIVWFTPELTIRADDMIHTAPTT